MKKTKIILFPALLCCYCLAIGGNDAIAQTKPLPYYSGFDSPDQKTGWQLIHKGSDATPYIWDYETKGYSPTTNIAHYYPVGSTKVVDDWFVSPALNFTSGGKVDSVRTSFSGFGVPGVGDTIGLYVLIGSPDPALASSIRLIFDWRSATDYKNDGIWRVWTTLSSIVIPPTSASAYIAFRYNTIDNWLDVKFDNIKVSSSTTGISEWAKQQRIYVYPNPASSVIHMSTPTEFKEIRIFDISGRECYKSIIEPSIDISALKSGFYTLECKSLRGEVIRDRFIKK